MYMKRLIAFAVAMAAMASFAVAEMRYGIANLRLTCGQNAVHSDPIHWAHDASATSRETCSRRSSAKKYNLACLAA